MMVLSRPRHISGLLMHPTRQHRQLALSSMASVVAGTSATAQHSAWLPRASFGARQAVDERASASSALAPSCCLPHTRTACATHPRVGACHTAAGWQQHGSSSSTRSRAGSLAPYRHLSTTSTNTTTTGGGDGSGSSSGESDAPKRKDVDQISTAHPLSRIRQ